MMPRMNKECLDFIISHTDDSEYNLILYSDIIQSIKYMSLRTIWIILEHLVYDCRRIVSGIHRKYSLSDEIFH